MKPVILVYQRFMLFKFAIPLTSVECERAFSRMNLTDLRNKLLTLDDLMLISYYGPKNLEELDPLPAITLWKSQKSRRFVEDDP